MKKQISIQQYRAIDLAILGGAYGICEILIYVASTFWYARELYIASPVAAITAIVMMRWGGWAGIHAAAGGFLYAYLRHGSWQQLLTFGAGNLLALAALLAVRLLWASAIGDGVLLFLLQTALLSIGLGLFNLIPIPPLDGSKVLFALLPENAYRFVLRYERYGMILLWVLVLTDIGGDRLSNAIYSVFAFFCQIIGI